RLAHRADCPASCQTLAGSWSCRSASSRIENAVAQRHRGLVNLTDTVAVLRISRRTRYLVRRIVRRAAVRFLPAHQKVYAHVDHLLPRGVLRFRGAGADDDLVGGLVVVERVVARHRRIPTEQELDALDAV